MWGWLVPSVPLKEDGRLVVLWGEVGRALAGALSEVVGETLDAHLGEGEGVGEGEGEGREWEWEWVRVRVKVRLRARTRERVSVRARSR